MTFGGGRTFHKFRSPNSGEEPKGEGKKDGEKVRRGGEEETHLMRRVPKRIAPLIHVWDKYSPPPTELVNLVGTEQKRFDPPECPL